MPSAPRIRKEVLQALENQIIPALYQQEVPLGNVTLPFRFPEGINTRLIRKTVPRDGDNSMGYPIQTHWPKAKLHSTFHFYIGFIYEGIADERTFVTAAQAAEHKIAKGIYALRWQAPAVLLFPPGTPRNTGSKASFWEGPEPPPLSMKILWLRICDQILIHVHEEPVGLPHPLQINDHALTTMANLFCEEMQGAPGNHQRTAQAIFLAMMLRLQQSFLIRYPQIANTSHPPTPIVANEVSSKQAHNAWQDAVIFIQMHLHEHLTVPILAQRVGFSPAHINRLFHQFSGVPVIRYVRLQRIAAARKILEEGVENINEIAALVGFSSATAFCRAFLQETGLTPNQFRREARHNKNAFSHR